VENQLADGFLIIAPAQTAGANRTKAVQDIAVAAEGELKSDRWITPGSGVKACETRRRRSGSPVSSAEFSDF
jgi:hypothetical protein